MPPPLPDALASILTESFAMLASGAADPASPWRTLALGSIGLDGTPRVRTVVLRAVHPAGAWLDVHTDTRSAKHAELTARPAATLHGWDPAGRVQLRLRGMAILHANDAAAAQAWSSLHEPSQRTYRVQPGPGTRLDRPDGQVEGPASAEVATGIFCVIRLHVQTLDWLHLAQGSHRRAGFTWDNGAITATWLAP